MSEKLTNDNIDKIFRDSIDEMETQPSENFWINASEDALFKSNLANSRAISNWKLIAASLAAALVFLSAYLIYTQRQLSNISQKLVVVEKQNSDQNKSVISISNGAPIASVSANQEKLQPVAEQKKPLTKKHKVIASKTQYAVQTNTSIKKKMARVAKQNALAFNTTASSHSSKNNHSFVRENRTSKSSTVSTASNIPVQQNVNSNDENSGQNKPGIQSNSISNTDNLLALTNTDKVSIPLINNQAPTITPDHVDPVLTGIKGTDHKNTLSRMSLSVFYEPYMSDELLENESSDIVTKNNVSANEEEINPYTIGIKIGYNISKHWTITTGCLFYNFNVSVSPATIYAQKQADGEIGYSFQTSAGTVSCPYGTSPSAGDFMIVSGKEIVNYISVPVQLKYNFITAGKFGLYITGGAMFNIVAHREMTMHWQDFAWNQGNATEGIDNSKKIYGSFYIAPGIAYKVFNNFSIFLEPSLQGSPIFSSAKNAPPYLGIGAGITCHL
ncbi:MAG TPA: hypothetical protein VK808_14015 [Bacteroidia bacterium]|jgi:hypothetical protein|nr:hypothetical protein [Bacteroidia bacterium]